jgi:hypothetical protein
VCVYVYIYIYIYIYVCVCVCVSSPHKTHGRPHAPFPNSLSQLQARAVAGAEVQDMQLHPPGFRKRNYIEKITEVSGRHTKYKYRKIKLHFIPQREHKIIERIAQRNWPCATKFLGVFPHLEIILTMPAILTDLYRPQHGPMKH